MIITPLVSIIVNNYNYGRFLADAIESALQQTYPSVEAIVVDDGSDDDSRQIMLRYAERIRPITKANGGQASAFNAGFALARGAIVIFLDADDILLQDAAQRAVDAFAAAPQTAKLMYRMAVIDAKGQRTGDIKPAPHLPLPTGDIRSQVLNRPFDLVWAATSGNAFPAWVLRRIFPIPEHVYGRVGADWYLSHITPLFGPVVFLDDICASYRVHDGNNYELAIPTLDLQHIRQTIIYAQITAGQIAHQAIQLGIVGSAPEFSVSDLANRLISLRLAPAEHLIVSDSVTRLLRRGIRAALRRQDIRLPMRLMFISWFLAMALVPRRVARALAIGFLFPERRVRVNRMLRLLHRQSVHPKHRLQVSK